MKIWEISDGDAVTQLAIKGFTQSCPLLADVEFITKTGAAALIKRAREASEKTLITRSLNSDNTATGPTPTYDTATKRIVSFDAKVDTILEDRNEDPETELAHQTYLEAKEAGYELNDLIINGDNSSVATDFDGWVNLVQTAQTDTAGVAAPVGWGDTIVAQKELFIEAIYQFIAKSGANALYMNNTLRVRALTVAKSLGYYQQSKDDLGNLVDTIGGVAIKSAGRKRDGSYFLPFTETANGGSSTSIWGVKWGEGEDLTAITSVGVKGRYVGQVGNYLTNSVNMDMVMHLQDHKALWRSQGWKLS